MGVVKSRGMTRKYKPVSGKIIQLKHKNISRSFAIHEDLLCATSTVFKHRFQRRRKAVDGECPICHEEFDVTVADITFCQSEYGQNIHVACFEDWSRSKAHPTCPMCRKDWASQDSTSALDMPSSTPLDSKALQVYIDWLYMDKIHVDPKLSPESDDYNLCLLKALTVSHTVKDKTFGHAIMAHLTEQITNKVNPGFRIASIKYAFKVDNYIPMKSFVLATCHPLHLVDLLRDEAQLPDTFKKEIDNFYQFLLGSALQSLTRGQYTLEKDGPKKPN